MLVTIAVEAGTICPCGVPKLASLLQIGDFSPSEPSFDTPQADDPHARAYGREVEQCRARRASARPATGARATSGGDRGRARDHERRGAGGPADGEASRLAREADRRAGGREAR